MAEKPPAKPKAERRQGRKRDDVHAAKLARFKEHYLAPGPDQHNATAAALAVGCAPKSAKIRGYEYVKKLRASGDLAETARRVAALAELNTANVLLEVQRVALNDPRRFFTPEGGLLRPADWDDHMAACVQSVEVDEVYVGKGKQRRVTGATTKIKFWPKLDALDKLMKHQGLFAKNNAQLQPNLAIQVNFVAAQPPQPAERAAQIQAVLVKPNGKNGSHP